MYSNESKENNHHQIFDLLLHDHKLITILLNDSLIYLEKHPLSDIPTITFKHLKWQIQRHIYIEEKTVFLFCEFQNVLNPEENHNLITEHDKLIKILDEIIKNPPDKLIKLREFTEAIKKHIKWETEGIYLKFDGILSLNEKNYINKELIQTSELGFYPIEKLRQKYAKTSSIECQMMR